MGRKRTSSQITKKAATNDVVKLEPPQYGSLISCQRIGAIRRLFNDDDDLMHEIFHPCFGELRAAPEEILRQSQFLSRSHQVLIKAALDIWCGAANLNIGEMLDVLDDFAVINFIKCICTLREIRLPCIKAIVEDLETGI